MTAPKLRSSALYLHGSRRNAQTLQYRVVLRDFAHFICTFLPNFTMKQDLKFPDEEITRSLLVRFQETMNQ